VAMLVVGEWREIARGDGGGRANLRELFGGKVVHLPARDALTLEPKP